MKLSQKDLDAAMRKELQAGQIKTTKEFARLYNISIARADSSLARVTRKARGKSLYQKLEK